MPSGSNAGLGFFGGLSQGVAQGFQALLPLLAQKNKLAQEKEFQDRIFKFKQDSEQHDQMVQAIQMEFQRFNSDFAKLPRDSTDNVSIDSLIKLQQNRDEGLMRIANYYGPEKAGPYVGALKELIDREKKDDKPSGVGAGLGRMPGPSGPRQVPSEKKQPRKATFRESESLDPGVLYDTYLKDPVEAISQNLKGMILPNAQLVEPEKDLGFTRTTDDLKDEAIKILMEKHGLDIDFAAGAVNGLGSQLILMYPEDKEKVFKRYVKNLKSGMDRNKAAQEALRSEIRIGQDSLSTGQ